MKNTAILRVACPDQKGLDAALADFIYRANGNILHFEQHQVAEANLYLARIEWDLTGFQIDVKDFQASFSPIAARLICTTCLSCSIAFSGFFCHVRGTAWAMVVAEKSA